ncbi:hypothetical protein GCM10010339_72970 [Streptomyces alanosinicus]|uniref:Uncharacterized protein n=1 Tax=Streptomyces alanosinicus TaxID=68171 RepID=A0A918YPJ2_9ACTN|nr:hypothetical protein GCM10010339_72970 [Streptomyces alanosinicus]
MLNAQRVTGIPSTYAQYRDGQSTSYREGRGARQCPDHNPCALNVPWPPDGLSPHMTRAGSETPPETPETPAQGHTKQYG